jgi:hypothetical protein
VIETVQPPVPEHAPDHPEKLEPAAGVAVSVTLVPLVNPAAHVEGHEIPAGVEDTVPLPSTVTVSASVGGGGTTSKAPMSQAGPCGRVTPRASVAAHPAPASIAGLPAWSAAV